MCGIAGVISITGMPVSGLDGSLEVLSRMVAHRGPDGDGTWIAESRRAGLAHRRLAIIDLSAAAQQPMVGPGPAVITYNGEIYNYLELRAELAAGWRFRSSSDTECILAAYDRYDTGCVDRLRGMFAFAIWDDKRRRLFCARDRFGIKPFYYALVENLFVFASEAKALLPFLPEIESDPAALAEYLTFQHTIGEATLFRGIKQLLPGHALTVENGTVRVWRYWDVHYEIDGDHNARYFERRLGELLDNSIRMHLRSDVPVGAYVSGGIEFEPDRHPRRQERARHCRLFPRPFYPVSGLRRERLRCRCGGPGGRPDASHRHQRPALPRSYR